MVVVGIELGGHTRWPVKFNEVVVALASLGGGCALVGVYGMWRQTEANNCCYTMTVLTC